MKRIYAPYAVGALSGKLAGNQELEYAENNNPAYEAPDGLQYARNYRAVMVAHRRSKDGLNYFSIRTKTATRLTNKSRMAMAVLGVTAAWKSALKTLQAQNWAKLHSLYDYAKVHDVQVASTFDKWINAIMGQMLRYKVSSRTMVQASISVVLVNPYLNSATAPLISQKTWIKFLPVLDCNESELIGFTIDSNKFFTYSSFTWEALLDNTASANPNLRASYSGISIPSAGDNPLYNNLPIYSADGVEQTAETEIAQEDYTTIEPNA